MLKTSVQDEMDRHTERIMSVVATKITDNVKELGLEVRSELQNHMKMISLASGNATPNSMSPTHPRRLLSLAHHRRTIIRRTMSTVVPPNFSKSKSSLFAAEATSDAASEAPTEAATEAAPTEAAHAPAQE